MSIVLVYFVSFYENIEAVFWAYNTWSIIIINYIVSDNQIMRPCVGVNTIKIVIMKVIIFYSHVAHAIRIKPL